MSIPGLLQIVLYGLIILAVTRPLGSYLFRVFEGEQKPLPRVLGPIERGLLRLCGVDPRREGTVGRIAPTPSASSGRGSR